MESFKGRVSHVINAAGVIDPNWDEKELFQINFLLPANIIRAISHSDVRLVTFGTVLENIESLNTSNAYLRSKLKLHDFIQENLNTNVLHLQMHTWYGGSKNPNHMFLGQVLDSIKNKTRFKMSSGNQLREYHHISDDVEALKHVLDSDFRGIVHISHGNPLRLKNLALAIFEYFDEMDLLEVGALPTFVNENEEVYFQRHSIYDSVVFRDALRGVPTWLGGLLK